jgi:hypothetical protein
MAWRLANGKTTGFPSAFHRASSHTAALNGNRLKIGLIGKPISSTCAAVHRFQDGKIGRKDDT